MAVIIASGNFKQYCWRIEITGLCSLCIKKKAIAPIAIGVILKVQSKQTSFLMFKYSQNTSQFQPKSNYLWFGLLGSILIHGVVALILSRNDASQTLLKEKIETIPIAILEEPQPQMPETTAVSEERSKLKSSVSPKPEKSASNAVTAAANPPQNSTATQLSSTPSPEKTTPVKPTPQQPTSSEKVTASSVTEKKANPDNADSSQRSTTAKNLANSSTIAETTNSTEQAPKTTETQSLDSSNSVNKPQENDISAELKEFRQRHQEVFQNRESLTSLDKPATTDNSEANSQNNSHTVKSPSSLSEDSSIADSEDNTATVPKSDDENESISSVTNSSLSGVENNNSSMDSTTNGNSSSQSNTTDTSNENTTTRGNDSAAENEVAAKPSKPLAISCRQNCQPQYPSALNGAEGSAGIQLTIDSKGKVIDAAIAVPHSNSQLNQKALEAAKQMKFSSIDRDRATVRINISFTVAGSDFERKMQEEQE